jgi:hypothetical protein
VACCTRDGDSGHGSHGTTEQKSLQGTAALSLADLEMVSL